MVAADGVCWVESRPIGLHRILPGGDNFSKTRRWEECGGVVRFFLPLAASLALGLSGCSKAPHTSGAKLPPVVTVRVETIEVKPHPVTEEVIGTVRAKIRAAVEARVSGRITRMAVDLGQPVREGDLIAEIDAQEIKARLAKRSRKADGTRACEQTEAENPQYRITLTRCIHGLLVGSPFSHEV